MTISQAFDLALQHHRSGRLADAEALYRQILAAQPNHADALHLLGVVANQAGRHDVAADLIRQAIAANPAGSHYQLDLGNALMAQGHLDESIAAFRAALQFNPAFAMAHNNLGIAWRAKGCLDEAVASHRQALEIDPNHADFHNNLSVALQEKGQSEEAVAACHCALRIKPDHPSAWYNLGIALQSRGQLDEAIAVYRRAIQIKPDHAGALNNMGAVLRDRGHLQDAIAVYHRALEVKPGMPETYNNLGIALKDEGRLDEAIAAYRRALQIDPGYVEALNDLGIALKDQGELDEAIAAFRQALRIKPNHPRMHSNLVYTLHYHPRHDAGTISEEQQRWNRQFSDPLKPFLQPHANDRSPERRLRVGYISPDFRDHTVARFVLPLFERHDREQFEILCYSEVLRPDSMTERLRALAAGWRSTVGVPDARMEEMIREDGVDILVDLTMHAADNRLPALARQPAPVQVAWLAYAGSTGLPAIGYRLTDDRMDPPGSRGRGTVWSAEEPVRLPDCWCCYSPASDSPEVNTLPAQSAGRITFGALNNFAKVHDGVLALWARVLAAVAGSRLLMFSPEGRTRERIRAFFTGQGIGTERVELVGFLPTREHLSLYHRIDIALDPFPYNGMATTCDALWMGVPVLTLPGAMPASRAGLSLLSSIGLAEFAASSEDDYVRLATELAADLPRLANLRATLRPRMSASPLMDAPLFARNVEAAYRSMWRRWLHESSAPLGMD